MGALMFPNYKAENFAYESHYNTQILAMSDKEFEQMANGFANGMTLKPEKRDILAQWIKTADRKTYVYGYTDLLQLDLREKLSEIKIPVTVIAATQPHGEATVKENISKQFENLGSYDLILAKNAAHFIMFDQPVWFNQQLEHILKN
jgi:pimeloyl-ACP methyl ester carboxylesterase